MSSNVYEYKDTQDWYVGEWSSCGRGFSILRMLFGRT